MKFYKTLTSEIAQKEQPELWDYLRNEWLDFHARLLFGKPYDPDYSLEEKTPTQNEDWSGAEDIRNRL